MAYVEKRISFDHERDSDIIDFLDSMTSHKANQLVRQLLRDFIKDEERSQLDRIESKVDRLSSDLSRMKLESQSYSASAGGEINEDQLSILELNLEKIGV